MVQQIKNHLKKYHEANLWIKKRLLFEEKKQMYQIPQVEPTDWQIPDVEIQYRPIVFSQADTGHNQEERNKIQELYRELDNLQLFSKLAL